MDLAELLHSDDEEWREVTEGYRRHLTNGSPDYQAERLAFSEGILKDLEVVIAAKVNSRLSLADTLLRDASIEVLIHRLGVATDQEAITRLENLEHELSSLAAVSWQLFPVVRQRLETLSSLRAKVLIDSNSAGIRGSA